MAKYKANNIIIINYKTMAKVYIVECEFNTEGSAEFENMLVTTNKQKAIDKVADEKQKCINQYYKNNDYEIETDEAEHFEIQVNNYDKYEIVKIKEYNLVD